VTVGTAFHRTHLPLQKWFLAIWLMLSGRRGISARALAREVQVNKNTACSVSNRIRAAMKERHQRELLLKIVEKIGE
jgi:hypothetical protein